MIETETEIARLYVIATNIGIGTRSSSRRIATMTGIETTTR
jgi:hypothetical protein